MGVGLEEEGVGVEETELVCLVLSETFLVLQVSHYLASVAGRQVAAGVQLLVLVVVAVGTVGPV